MSANARCLPGGPAQWLGLEPQPMEAVPGLVSPLNVSPTMAPAPKSIPLPAFVDRCKHSEEKAMDYSSDTSTADESASQNISVAEFLGPQPECVAGVATSQSASIHQPASKPKASWQIVWCCERCHQPTRIENMQSFNSMVKTLGGNIHLLKRAEKIKSHQLKSRYVLVSDWRDAKPFLDVFEKVPSMTRPSLMIIICNAEGSYRAAVQWAESVPTMKSFSAMRCEVLHGRDDIPADPPFFKTLIQMEALKFAQEFGMLIQ